jgi:mono/diheme cytochrome c family protein
MKTSIPQILLSGILVSVSAAGVHGQPLDGRMMFREYCAVCHGNEGRGDGPVASALKRAPTDLTEIARRHGGRFPKLMVMRVIEGIDFVGAHGNRPMPIWGSVFRSRDGAAVASLRVNALMEYVAQLQR